MFKKDISKELSCNNFNLYIEALLHSFLKRAQYMPCSDLTIIDNALCGYLYTQRAFFSADKIVLSFWSYFPTCIHKILFLKASIKSRSSLKKLLLKIL